jgi:multisubunit Na+/H+ antiporter MnhB subunit
MRFIIVVIIESLTVLTIRAALIREFDNREWAMKYRDVRNFLIALAAGIIVFFMFGNMLRFDWAYTEDGSLHLTTSMLMWMSLSVMVFCLSGPGSNINSNSNINSDVKNKDDVKN